MISLEQRYQGCQLGLAVGDAVGTTVEFKPPGTFPLVEDMVDGGPFGLNPGEWTDDTSMALCLAGSLITCKGFDARDQMELYVRWWKEGCLSSNGKSFDIGGTVSKALHRYQQTGNPFCGSTDPHSAGNGSLMRIAPVALFFAFDPERAILLSGESSRTAHGARSFLDDCLYLSAGLLVGAVLGTCKEELLVLPLCTGARSLGVLTLCREIDEIACGSFKQKPPPCNCRQRLCAPVAGSGFVGLPPIVILKGRLST